MIHLLIIDHDVAFLDHVRSSFPAPCHRIELARTGVEGLASLRASRPDVILLAAQLSDGSGLEVLAQLRLLDARIPVIFTSVSRASAHAIEAVRYGAFDCLYKPLDPLRLQDVVAEAVSVARTPLPALSNGELEGEDTEGALTGTCAAMANVYKAIGRVAGQDVTVLITGDSGTGKELVARALHRHSARAKAPFLALNCAAIPEPLLESELFGHEKGAFTGADRRRVGKFEQCHGGTLLLDEIGDMPLGLQAKILRVLQEQTFERVGGSETFRTDVRIVAATHRDLKSLASANLFRADLYYRLGVFTIALPSLHERGEDLCLLIAHYLRRFNRELGRDVRALSPETLQRLQSYSWPGNIRELQSVLKIALLNSSGPVLLPCFLPALPEVARAPSAPVPRTARSTAVDLATFIEQRLHPTATELYAETHGQVDRLLLTRALRYTNGNHREAARLLGISRQTMRIKLRALGVSTTPTYRFDEPTSATSDRA